MTGRSLLALTGGAARRPGAGRDAHSSSASGTPTSAAAN